MASGDGKEALVLFSQTTFDFVISDLYLRSPLTGIDVLRECRRLRPSTNFLVTGDRLRIGRRCTPKAKSSLYYQTSTHR